MDLLSPIIGDTAARIVVLVGVLLLLAALTMLLIGVAFRVFRGRRFGFRGSRNRAPRLSVPDIMPIDSKRKLVLIRRDAVEHLLLIGGSTDLVIEQSIQRPVQAAVRRTGVNGVHPTPPQTVVTQAELPTAAQSESPAQAVVSNRLGIPMPPPRGTRPTATAAAPAEIDAPKAVDSAPPAPATRQVGIALPPRPMPIREMSPASAESDNAPLGEDDIRLNGTSGDEMFAAGTIPQTGGATANGHDEQLERDFAAVVPAIVDAPVLPPPAGPEPPPSSNPEDAEQQRAQRLTSRETEMAQLLNEIFGKR